MKWLFAFVLLFTACTTVKIETARPDNLLTGTDFYKIAAAFNWRQRDSFAVQQVLAGNIPGFLKTFIPVDVFHYDSLSGDKIKATIFVSPDYLSIGTPEDWARVPITPMAAKQIAGPLNCVLPSAKMVDAIYKAAKVKLPPVPLFAFRDSSPTMYHHHLIIEGQRKQRNGLIAGIKKDVLWQSRPGKVAIYGWHRTDGNPIQPLYQGHVDWYVDYSHGIRLVYRKFKIDGRWVDFEDLLKNEKLEWLVED